VVDCGCAHRHRPGDCGIPVAGMAWGRV